MRINFVLPFAGNKPIGGFKIVYEYANRLTERGHEVFITHPAYTFKEGFVDNIKYKLRYIQRKIDKSYLPGSWFRLSPEVKPLWVPSINNKYLPDADAVISTAWRTAACIMPLSESKGRKFYFIQHYEIWNGPELEVKETWKLPLIKIVIAKWLLKIAQSMNEKAYYVPNAFDPEEFSMLVPPENRNKHSVMMLYNELPFKGSVYAIKAMSRLKSEIPELKLTLFGVPERPDIPGWIDYYRKPDRELLRKLYNEAAIFISPSFEEGFPLPPAEAQMCGAALAASDIGGHHEYVSSDQTAVLFMRGNEEQLMAAVKDLIVNNEKRIMLAYNGNRHIGGFTWQKSTGQFEKVLMDNAA